MTSQLLQLRPLSEPRDGVVYGTIPRTRVLRLSVTDLCNFRCRYCMPEEGLPKLAHSDLLSLEELARLAKWLVNETGIDKVRLTGGEPLVRKGITHLISELSSAPTIREVTLTTNATLLPQMARDLKLSGLTRVNISLDSLDAERFALVTRGGKLDRTLAGIKAAQQAGLTPIKINTVLHRSTWKQEVPDLLDFAASNQFEIRFIELMRTGTERAWCEAEYVSVDEVCSELGAEVVVLPRAAGDRSPARPTLVKWRRAIVKVGWISPRSHPFCSSCERLRMDARGRLRRCLMDPTTLDFADLLARGDQRAARQVFESYLARKVPPSAMDNAVAMSQIGG